MAAEAVSKIKEAEDQAKEILRAANEKARSIALNAEKDSAARKKSILAEAYGEREAKIAAASEKALKECEVLVSNGEDETKKLLSPEPEKFTAAVNLIIERIVKADGNN